MTVKKRTTNVNEVEVRVVLEGGPRWRGERLALFLEMINRAQKHVSR